jgi:acetyl-CoA carboxylase beta subunit
MASSQVWWMIWPDNVALSILVWFVIAMPFLYAARKPVHALLRSVSHAFSGPLRLGSHWLLATAKEMQERNKAVLLAHGQEETGQRVEREFERVAALVTRDLQGYPALQRKLLDEITRIEEDYKKTGEVPPPPPEWVTAVEAMAKVKSSGNEMVQNVLEEINRSVNTIHDKALADYRRAYESRHKILAGFMPFWRSLDKTMQQVDKKLTGLETSAAQVDAQMQKYEQIAKKTDKAEQTLTHSAFTQFAIALLVMAVAVGGAFINFKLIALPMSEMVGAGDYIAGSLRTSEVAALVIIFVEASMGLFLMEALRVTHLFPRIANLHEHMRRRMMWIALVLLVTLAGIEAALALMRDMLIADKQALVQSLAAAQQAAPADPLLARIPTAGQMLLGFILPFALAFVAVPLESLIHSSRTVGGAALVAIVRTLALTLRLLGNLARQLCRVLVTLYDVVIVLPLLVERWVNALRSGAAGLEAGRRTAKS